MKNTLIYAATLLAVASPLSLADTPHNAPQRVIYRAAAAGAAELQQALSTGLNINAVDDDRETALMRAADKGNLSAVRNLIAAGADVNRQDEDGETALMIAADDGYTEIVQALIAAGANVNLRNDDGETALDIATEERHRHTAEVLRNAR